MVYPITQGDHNNGTGQIIDISALQSLPWGPQKQQEKTFGQFVNDDQ